MYLADTCQADTCRGFRPITAPFLQRLFLLAVLLGTWYEETRKTKGGQRPMSSLAASAAVGAPLSGPSKDRQARVAHCSPLLAFPEGVGWATLLTLGPASTAHFALSSPLPPWPLVAAPE
ncbi:hypothetical protein CDD82_3778 [Ophiocordyceps australis]|uniref:Uncharacterized protein n=1 Tax=Ophiocordyceps australis TaxID=1399860 RepID=A0A2C5ZA01_9HYPO|nr:hypothetical protein CDD82_3778 [Ophiocordyceps australis]